MLVNSKRHIDRRGAEVNMIKFTVLNNMQIFPDLQWQETSYIV